MKMITYLWPIIVIKYHARDFKNVNTFPDNKIMLTFWMLFLKYIPCLQPETSTVRAFVQNFEPFNKNQQIVSLANKIVDLLNKLVACLIKTRTFLTNLWLFKTKQIHQNFGSFYLIGWHFCIQSTLLTTGLHIYSVPIYVAAKIMK